MVTLLLNTLLRLYYWKDYGDFITEDPTVTVTEDPMVTLLLKTLLWLYY